MHHNLSVPMAGKSRSGQSKPCWWLLVCYPLHLAPVFYLAVADVSPSESLANFVQLRIHVLRVDYFLRPFVSGSSAQKIHCAPFACFSRDESNPRCSS